MAIDNTILARYHSVNERIKKLEKQKDDLKETIKATLQARAKHEIITTEFIATLQEQKRRQLDLDSLPDDVKKEYTITKTHSILKVLKRG